MSSREIEPKKEVFFSGSLWIGNHSVNLFKADSDKINLINGMMELSRLGIPGLRISKERSNAEYSIVCDQDKEPSLNLDATGKVLTAYGKKEDFEDGQALSYLAFWLTEAQRHAESTYTMQSASLAIGGNGVLLLGYSGEGKTSVLLKLCQLYNCEVSSNNLTFLRHDSGNQQIYADDGTKDIRPRLTAVHDFPDLEKYFPRSDKTWETKVSIYPEDVGAISAKSSQRIVKIFEIHYDNRGEDKLVVKEEKGLDVRYRLYENMSRIIRGAGVSVFGSRNNFWGYMPSLDTLELHNLRTRSIETMVNKIGIVSVSGGNLSELADTIYSRIDKIN